jgi:hypothetical protein
MIRIHPLKRGRRNVKVDPKLSGQRKEKEKEKVLCLVAMEGEGKIPFHFFPLSPQPIFT